MQPVVYILQSAVNGRFYIGSTTNLGRRFDQHQAGKSRSTKAFRPWRIVFNQSYPTYSAARLAEVWLKKQKDRNFVERIILEGRITKHGHEV